MREGGGWIGRGEDVSGACQDDGEGECEGVDEDFCATEEAAAPYMHTHAFPRRTPT